MRDGDAEAALSLGRELAASIPGEQERVYMLRCCEFYKIGRAINVHRRLSHLQGGCPFEIAIVASYGADDAIGGELYWHKRFKKKRVRGEWFELSDEERDEFVVHCETLVSASNGFAEAITNALQSPKECDQARDRFMDASGFKKVGGVWKRKPKHGGVDELYGRFRI